MAVAARRGRRAPPAARRRRRWVLASLLAGSALARPRIADPPPGRPGRSDRGAAQVAARAPLPPALRSASRWRCPAPTSASRSGPVATSSPPPRASTRRSPPTAAGSSTGRSRSSRARAPTPSACTTGRSARRPDLSAAWDGHRRPSRYRPGIGILGRQRFRRRPARRFSESGQATRGSDVGRRAPGSRAVSRGRGGLAAFSTLPSLSGDGRYSPSSVASGLDLLARSHRATRPGPRAGVSRCGPSTRPGPGRIEPLLDLRSSRSRPTSTRVAFSDQSPGSDGKAPGLAPRRGGRTTTLLSATPVGREAADRTGPIPRSPTTPGGAFPAFLRRLVGGRRERRGESSSGGGASLRRAPSRPTAGGNARAASRRSPATVARASPPAPTPSCPATRRAPSARCGRRNRHDVVALDLVNGRLARVSVGAGPSEPDASSAAPSLSGNGRFVAFHSAASNLVPGDSNETTDVFVRERMAELTLTANPTDFGSVPVAAPPGASRTVTVTSTGALPARVTGLTLAGTNAADFLASADTCTGVVLYPGDACTVRILSCPRSPVADGGAPGDRHDPDASPAGGAGGGGRRGQDHPRPPPRATGHRDRGQRDGLRARRADHPQLVRGDHPGALGANRHRRQGCLRGSAPRAAAGPSGGGPARPMAEEAPRRRARPRAPSASSWDRRAAPSAAGPGLLDALGGRSPAPGERTGHRVARVRGWDRCAREPPD